MTARRSADPPVWLATLLAGFVVGAFNITDAILFFSIRGVAPMRIPQTIVAGLIGPAAFRGGWRTAFLGFALHFLIAATAAAIYILASRRWTVLARRPWLCGGAYGFGVFLFMNFVVVPLSRTGVPRFTPAVTINLLFAHVCLIGWTIAQFARWASGNPSRVRGV